MMSEQVSTLIRDELKLAQLEMTSKGKQAALGAGCSGRPAWWLSTAWAACWRARSSPSAASWRPGSPRSSSGAALLAAAGVAALLGKQRLQGPRRRCPRKPSPASRPTSRKSRRGRTDDGHQEQIQQEIEQTRERLGETVEELAAKADVKARAQAKAAEVKAQAQAKAADVKTRPRPRRPSCPGRCGGARSCSAAGRSRWPRASWSPVRSAVWRWRRKVTALDPRQDRPRGAGRPRPGVDTAAESGGGRPGDAARAGRDRLEEHAQAHREEVHPRPVQHDRGQPGLPLVPGAVPGPDRPARAWPAWLHISPTRCSSWSTAWTPRSRRCRRGDVQRGHHVGDRPLVRRRDSPR